VKLVGIFAGNAARGAPTHQAVICQLDAETGACRAVMDGTALTEARTAAAAALSARLLARPDARVLVVVGTGAQAAAHLHAVPAALALREIRVAGRDLAAARALAAAHPGAVAVEGIEAAVRGADVLCLCTSAAEPVVAAGWVGPGTHVTSVGYAPPGGELAPELAERAALFVEARTAFEPPPAGCAELAGLDPRAAAELGEVLLGRRPGRPDPEAVTVYKSMGHVVEDLAAAALVARQARAAGLGREVDLLA
jgi:alanine dehydrogenase